MRLWHINLIHYLPRQQLLSQWREIAAIAKRLAEEGTPNHILVNRILDYPSSDFFCYYMTVYSEMLRRKYKLQRRVVEKIEDNIFSWAKSRKDNPVRANRWEIFAGWHTDRYLRQCIYNLEEKFDCGGISEEEWDVITERFGTKPTRISHNIRKSPTECTRYRERGKA